jgi:hypothetical protein
MSDADLPGAEAAFVAPVVPPPWTLRGRGLIVALRPADGADVRGPALLILADDASSTAGPYGELLYIPGAVRPAGGGSPSRRSG